MAEGGRRRSSREPHNPSQGLEWCSVRSILDVQQANPETAPVEPPFSRYLNEVASGMRGGEGDVAARAAEAPSVDRVQGLERILAHTSARNACRSLFWLTFGALFDQLSSADLQAFRASLGQSWYLLSLAILEGMSGDRKLLDWVSAALPFVFAQAIYRILVDAFSEDRSLFIAHAEKLVCKTTLVVHFEVTGFQILPETAERERKRLFLKQMVKNPHINQNDFQAGQRRQEKLESQKTNSCNQPLRFGPEDNRPLEESQLDHVMQGRSAERNQRSRQPRPTPVPGHLGVDRYAHLTSQGERLLERQLREQAIILGEVERPDAEDAPSPKHGADSSQQGLPLNSLSPRSQGTSASSDDEHCASSYSPHSSRPQSSVQNSPSARSPKAKLQRKKSGSLFAIGALSGLHESVVERREREAMVRKSRQDLVLKKIGKPLSEALRERQLVTTWVSPCQQSLVNDAKDRNLLRKASSQAFRLTMATRPQLMRPLSLPDLTGSKALREQHRLKRGLHESQASNQRDDGASGDRVSPGKAGRSPSKTRPDDTTSQLPRMTTSTGTMLNDSKTATRERPWGTGANRGEMISLEEPARLTTKVVTKRLEDQEIANKQTSFALYVKEYDVFTNQRKPMRIDAKQLKDEEDATLREHLQLFGGPPVRQLPAELMLLLPARS